MPDNYNEYSRCKAYVRRQQRQPEGIKDLMKDFNLSTWEFAALCIGVSAILKACT